MAEKSKKYIVDVAPLVRLNLSANQIFSYFSEENIPAGSLVKIPFLKRNLEGIVLKSRADFERLGNVRLKKIEKILEDSFLTKEQLVLADFLSKYYFSGLGTILKNFVPRRVKARGAEHRTYNIEQKKIILTPEQRQAIKCISHSKFKIQNSKFLLCGPSGSGKTEIYIHSMQELRKNDPASQFLVLLPEKTLTPQALERYGEHFPAQEIVLLTSSLSKGRFFENWKKIRSGEAKIIIGTRMSVFAPFLKLKMIVIDEEQDMSFKQWDMNPRYDARVAAEKMAAIYGAVLVRGSATALVESYWRAQKNELSLVNISDFGKKPSPFLVVDMKKERWEKNFSCLSKKLRSEISYVLKQKKQALLFINRQGMSGFSVCQECRQVLRCPVCERALIADWGGHYYCPHCAYKTEIIPKCQSCGSLIFRQIGIGTQKVAREIASFFPSARILVADTPSSKKSAFSEKIYADFSKKKADILVGTQMISKGWDLPGVILTGIIDADNLLSFPDFSTEERFFENIVQASGRSGRPGSDRAGLTLIQTFHPENPIIRLAAEKNYAGFFEKEIATRKILSLPPFSKIIKLVYQSFDRKKTDQEAERVRNILARKSSPEIRISEAFQPMLAKIRGRFRSQIIIRIGEGKENPLKEELKKLGNGWSIDVDPISII